MRLHKFASLAAILRRDPREFVSRVRAIAQGRLEPLRVTPGHYQPSAWEAFARDLDTALSEGFIAALEEPALREMEERMARALAALAEHAPYTMAHNADVRLARCCYAICRATRPRIVIETGVGYGVTTAFLLHALEENGSGELHSVDLPPLERGSEDVAGVLVPAVLRGRWQLHRGWSRQLLPELLEQLGGVDVFLHDSMHTYDNMHFEFEQVWPRLRAGGALVADDIDGNTAFAELRARSPAFWGVAAQSGKPARFGVLIR